LKLADVRWGPEVDIEGIKPQTIRAIVIAAAVFADFDYDCWVTSVVRPENKDSLHGYGLAVDFDSSKDVTEAHFKLMRNLIELRLGENYDVVYHLGHIHAEYDVTGHDIELYRDG
jgi:hypothetical protein